MSIDRGVVMCSDDHSFVICSSSDYSSASLVPGSMDVFEMMWVDPWLEFIFVLLIHWVVDGGGTRVE